MEYVVHLVTAHNDYIGICGQAFVSVPEDLKRGSSIVICETCQMMALHPRPGNRFDDCTSVRELVHQAVGAASMCWEHVDRAGVFDDAEARKVAEELQEKLESFEPLLGFATNRQLWNELDTRFSVGHRDMDYRTVDGE